jgi:hypothetical protein
MSANWVTPVKTATAFILLKCACLRKCYLACRPAPPEPLLTVSFLNVGVGPCRYQKGASDYPYFGGLAAGGPSEKFFRSQQHVS